MNNPGKRKSGEPSVKPSFISLLSINSGDGIEGGYQTKVVKLRQMFLKPNVNNGYYCEEDGKKYLIPRRLKVLIIEKGSSLPGLPPGTIGYKAKVIDQNATLSIKTLLFSPEIYFPIIALFIILIFAFAIKKFYFTK